MWHGHSSGMGIHVAWAFMWHGHSCGMGIHVAWAFKWHGHSSVISLIHYLPSTTFYYVVQFGLFNREMCVLSCAQNEYNVSSRDVLISQAGNINWSDVCFHWSVPWWQVLVYWGCPLIKVSLERPFLLYRGCSLIKMSLERPFLLYRGCSLIKMSPEDGFYCIEDVLSSECPLKTDFTVVWLPYNFSKLE